MKFDELLNNVIGYIYSLPPIGFFLLFLVGTGVLIDSILNNDGRKKVTEYILLTSGSRERFKFLKVYTYLLDKVFSFNKRGLIFYPAVTKSTACSILVVLIKFSV